MRADAEREAPVGVRHRGDVAADACRRIEAGTSCVTLAAMTVVTVMQRSSAMPG